MKKVLVAGATGYLGRYVVKEFKKQGYWVRILARSAAKAESLNNYADEKFISDINNIPSLSGICKDIDIVFSSIGITKQKDGLTYMDVDYQGNMNLLNEAKKYGADKFIYISVLNVEKMKNLKAIKAKIRFEKELKKSGIDYTIVYPNGFFSDMKEYLKMAKKGKGQVFGSGNYKMNPIHGEDLAEVCVNAATNKDKEIKVGGPEILTHNAIFEIAFNSIGREVNISNTPIWVRDILVATLRIFTSVKTYGPEEFFMTVLAMDMIAPKYGKHHLKNFFNENKC